MKISHAPRRAEGRPAPLDAWASSPMETVQSLCLCFRPAGSRRTSRQTLRRGRSHLLRLRSWLGTSACFATADLHAIPAEEIVPSTHAVQDHDTCCTPPRACTRLAVAPDTQAISIIA